MLSKLKVSYKIKGKMLDFLYVVAQTLASCLICLKLQNCILIMYVRVAIEHFPKFSIIYVLNVTLVNYVSHFNFVFLLIFFLVWP
jgi:hypothetical protein